MGGVGDIRFLGLGSFFTIKELRNFLLSLLSLNENLN